MKTIRNVLAAACLALVSVPASTALADTVRVLVNDDQITDTQIATRAALLRLERRGSSNSARLQMASDELIEESLMLQEAKRLGITITDKQLSDAYLNVARGLRVSVDNLDQILTSNGVNPDTLKARLRANLAWQQVTNAAVAPRVQISEGELERQAEENLQESESFDYLLKEIIFVIPQDSKVSPARRTAEANQFRKSFQGCDSAVDLSLSYTDAAVVDVGRRHATQLPDAMAAELASLNAGGITKPRVTERGVSMLAVCSKSSAKDTTFLKDELRQEEGQEKFKQETDAYLARLKERAAITAR